MGILSPISHEPNYALLVTRMFKCKSNIYTIMNTKPCGGTELGLHRVHVPEE